jgi:hypothetical protein
MIIGQLAFTAAAIFTGAALYINAVEHPARMNLADGPLLTEWKPAYKRGTAMQGPIAVAGFLLGAASFALTGDVLWLAGALLMIANWPYTFLVIMPTNRRLMATAPAEAGAATRAMIGRWEQLHRGRTALGAAATLAFALAPAAG